MSTCTSQKLPILCRAAIVLVPCKYSCLVAEIPLSARYPKYYIYEKRKSVKQKTDALPITLQRQRHDIKDYGSCLIKVIDSLERNCIFNYTNCVHDDEIMYNNSNMK